MADDTGAEARLRELLHDQGWSLAPRPDAMARIRRAARRQRIRAAGATAGAAAVIAAAAIAVPLANSGTGTPRPTQHPPAQRIHSIASTRVVPDVVGMQLPEAEAVARASSGVIFVVKSEHAQVPEGTVISQHPAAGATVTPGSRLTLVVSSGG